MYIDVVPNRNSSPTILLREGWREGRKIRKRTIANLTDWPKEKVEVLRRLLKNETLVSANDTFVIERSLPHGHVALILSTIKKLGLDRLIYSRPSRNRNLVIAMITEQLIHSPSKLGMTRLWHDTTLAEELGVENADEDDLYEAMDWLNKRQRDIEKKLAKRHLTEGGRALYDVTSSYYEGRTCPLTHFGHNRDRKKGKEIIVYGVMCDDKGRPLAVQVYPGCTGDPTTVPDQVEKLKSLFKIDRVVLVGDRGMLTQTQIDMLKEHPGIGFISALRSNSIRDLIDQGYLQLSLFDKQNLAEITSPQFPNERLVVCFNPLLAEERGRKRQELIKETEKGLEKIAREVSRRRRKLLSKAEIAYKVGRVINHFKMAKHFLLVIEDSHFSFSRNEESIASEAEIDGIYVIRTSEPKGRLSADDVVRGYKSLSQVEWLFRTLKGIDIKVQPIRHREEMRVKAHIFICMLAYYVEWHMREALSPILFDDEQLKENRKMRDPVLPTKPSASAKEKKNKRKTDDGLEIQSFKTLFTHLGTLCRNRCRVKNIPNAPPYYEITQMTPLQKRAFDLLGVFPVT